jgi:hypothetical protein
MVAGGNRIAVGWTLAGVCWLFAVLLMTVPTGDYPGEGEDMDADGIDDWCDMDPFDPGNRGDDGSCDESTDYGAGACCCVIGFISLLIVQSGKDAKKRAQTQVLFVQQPTPQVIHHHTTHSYVPQPAPSQVPVSVPKATKPAPPSTPPANSTQGWATEARNLELARDWEGAAKAYQKAGMYEEAGRVREMHLEKKEPQVKIDIAQLGDNIQDSVVMKDGQTQGEEYQG